MIGMDSSSQAGKTSFVGAEDSGTGRVPGREGDDNDSSSSKSNALWDEVRRNSSVNSYTGSARLMPHP